MADHSKVLDIIAKSTDADRLRRILKNARTMEVTSVEDAAFGRLVDVLASHGRESIDDVDRDFWKTIHAFEEMLSEERGRTVRLTRTRQKIARKGIRQTLVDFAMKKTPTSGFEMLIELGRADLTGEALILKHGHAFDSEVCAAARTRLENAGVDLNVLPVNQLAD